MQRAVVADRSAANLFFTLSPVTDFTVWRSPFAVQRSPFTGAVERLAFEGGGPDFWLLTISLPGQDRTDLAE
jgi:hypothetical protein